MRLKNKSRIYWVTTSAAKLKCSCITIHNLHRLYRPASLILNTDLWIFSVLLDLFFPNALCLKYIVHLYRDFWPLYHFLKQQVFNLTCLWSVIRLVCFAQTSWSEPSARWCYQKMKNIFRVNRCFKSFSVQYNTASAWQQLRTQGEKKFLMCPLLRGLVWLFKKVFCIDVYILD